MSTKAPRTLMEDYQAAMKTIAKREDRCLRCMHPQAEHTGPKHLGMCIGYVRATGRESSMCQCNAFKRPW